MTAAFEATLAMEMKIPYALICMVDNLGNGLADRDLSLEEFKKGVHQNQLTVEKVCSIILRR